MRANDNTFSCLTLGSGPLVLCLHGFPDTPVAFVPLMRRLAERGYKVVAPWLRGYPPSERGEGRASSVRTLAEDILALIDACEERPGEPAILIAHDWGANGAYTATNMAPERVRRLVTASAPHLRILTEMKPWPFIKVYWLCRHFIQFMLPRGLSNWLTRRRNLAYIDTLYRRWSPNWDFDASDLADIKASLSQPGGLDGALSYYRDYPEFFFDHETQEIAFRPVSPPTLTFIGTADRTLELSTYRQTLRDCFIGPYEIVELPGVGHFPHREDPERFIAEILDFLAPHPRPLGPPG